MSEEHKADDGPAEGDTETQTVPVTFETFILSMGANALVHLGEVPHPETGEHAQHMLLARQTIDILGVLADKTKGNLTDQEARVLQATLYDLRMRFIECCGGDKADGADAAGDAGAA